MNTTSPRNDNQEVDLASVTQGIRNMMTGFSAAIFKSISFVIKNAILFGLLIIIGGIIGYVIDHYSKKTYEHQVIVRPNFESTDYLYSKIQLLESRLDQRDTVFLKKVGFTNPKGLVKIKIEPVVDLFKFINNSTNENNYKLLELMAEDSDIKKVAEEKATSKNYPYHSITFVTKGKTSREETIKPLLNYLNDSGFYKKVQNEYLINFKIRLKETDIIISQIDEVLKNFKTTSSDTQKGVYINENSQLNDVLETKDRLVREQGQRRIELVSLDKVIKDTSVVINIRDKSSILGKATLVVPLIFIVLFILGRFFISFYKKQSLKYQKNESV